MSKYQYTSHSRFEGSCEAQQLPVLGVDRQRERAYLMRLVVAGATMFWTGVIIALVKICG